MKYLVVIICAVLLAGCARAISSEMLKDAEKACSTNGGISRLFNSTDVGFKVYCNNGAVFYVEGKEND